MIGFEESKNSAIMKEIILFGLFGFVVNAFGQTTCVDPLACNFTELGECEFLDDNGMPCVTEGCAIPGACNFNPEADINDGSCEFTSCLGCTDEAACNYDAEAVYLDLSCIYFVDCNGVCGGDWIEDECGNCYAPPPSGGFVTFNFSSCGAQGPFGPTEEQVNAAYNGEFVDVVDGIQKFVVPYDGVYRITAGGAQGGSVGGYSGGLGAVMAADFELFEGDTLSVLIGQMGLASGDGSGGGGGTFVLKGFDIQAGQLLLAAGGGGGATSYTGFNGRAAEVGESGGDSNIPGTTGCLNNGYGGNGGNGGGAGCAGGGGGFLSQGQAGYHAAGGGLAFTEGGAGGIANYDPGNLTHGGFGGGGAGSYANGYGGGGGGYSGGGGGGWNGSVAGFGGGGGSYHAGINPESLYNENEQDGFVALQMIEFSGPDCELGCAVAQACNFNPEATNDDGSCDFCFCGPGTEYDIELGQCMIVNGSPDINGDGCTNLNDLLDLLSGYGTCED